MTCRHRCNADRINPGGRQAARAAWLQDAQAKVPPMRTLTLAALLLSLVATAQAQTTTFRDGRGSITGRAEQRGNTTVFRDNRGSITGRARRR